MRALNGEKSALRAKMLALRDGCADRIVRDVRILERILALPVYQKAETLLCYVSVGSETDTRGLLDTALKSGKAVYAPRCFGSGKMEFYRVHNLDALSPGRFGIPEPEQNESARWTAGEALCIVPGLCFTPNGARLGYGGGYYDRFLAAHRVQTLGLCYAFQLVEKLEQEPYDQKVDGILTDTGYLRCETACSERKGWEIG